MNKMTQLDPSEAPPWRVDGDKIVAASGIAVMTFDSAAADQLAFWSFIVESVNASRREVQESVANDGLLPCPFCGGAAETDSQQAYCNISTGRAETAVAVYCTSCGAQHTICRGDVPDAGLSDVTELWNRRAAPPSPAPAGEVERLRRALEFYANPEVYKPHPHGPAFDRRDLSAVALAALNGGRSE